MAPQLPVFKLAFAFVKQIHRPASSWISQRAKKSEFFRSKICMPPAQFYHWCEVKMKMWVMNLGRPVEIPKLNEQMAIELGANLLGEGIIFSIAAAILVAEYVRQVKKEAGKEQARQDYLQDMADRLRDVEMENISHKAEISELKRLCMSFQEILTVKDKPTQDPPVIESAQSVKQEPTVVLTAQNPQLELTSASAGIPGMVKTALSFMRIN